MMRDGRLKQRQAGVEIAHADALAAVRPGQCRQNAKAVLVGERSEQRYFVIQVASEGLGRFAFCRHAIMVALYIDACQYRWASIYKTTTTLILPAPVHCNGVELRMIPW